MDPEKVARAKALRAKQLRAKASGGFVDPYSKAQREAEVGLLESVGNIADYPAGIARMTALEATKEVMPEDLYAQPTPEDWQKALNLFDVQPAPSMSEMAQRAGREPGAGDVALDVVLDPFLFGAGGAAATKAGRKFAAKYGPLSQGMEKSGEKLYRYGLRAIDAEGAKFGKDPVSKLLLKHGVWGDYDAISKQMDDIANGYLVQRELILRAADEMGGQVDMAKAMQPLQDEVNKLKTIDDPNYRKLADTFQKDIDEYKKLSRAGRSEIGYTGEPVPEPGVEAGGVLKGGKEMRALPETAYRQDLPGAPYSGREVVLPKQSKYVPPGREYKGLPIGQEVQPPGTFTTKPDELYPGGFKYPEEFDVQLGQITPEKYIQQTPEVGWIPDDPLRVVPGKEVPEKIVRPSTASKFKTSEYSRIGDSAFKEAVQSSKGKELQKKKAFGLKRETERAVEKSIGKRNANRLKELNEKLGMLLTSKEKAAKEAGKELLRMGTTQVDAMAIAIDPAVYLAKQAGKAAGTSRFTTGVGLGLHRIGRSGLTDIAAAGATPAWLKMYRSETPVPYRR